MSGMTMRIPGSMLLLVVLLVGCTTRKQTDLLEARLRDQESRISELMDSLDRSQADLKLAQKQNLDLTQQLSQSGQPVLQPEQANVLYRLAGVRIDPLQSAILPVSQTSESMLNLVLTPLDQYDEPLKIPADLTVEVRVSRQVVETFQLSATELASRWNSGWLSSGYILQFPLSEQTTAAKNLDVTARFRSLDGREFTDKLRIAGQHDPPVMQAVPRPPEFDAEPDRIPDLPDETTRMETSDRRTVDEFPIYR